MLEIVVGVLSGFSSAVVVASFFYSFFSDLKRELKKLEKERVEKLENRVEYHINNDVSQRILQKLATLANAQTKMDAKLDRIGEDTAGQAAQIKGQTTNISAILTHLSNVTNSLEVISMATINTYTLCAKPFYPRCAVPSAHHLPPLSSPISRPIQQSATPTSTPFLRV